MLREYEHINIAILNGSRFTENKGLIDYLQVIWFIHMVKITCLFADCNPNICPTVRAHVF